MSSQDSSSSGVNYTAVPLDPPSLVKTAFPLDDLAEARVASNREAIANIFGGLDKRLLLIICARSVHDRHTAAAFAADLSDLQAVLPAAFVVGQIIPARLDIRTPRAILLEIGQHGVPAAAEFEDIYHSAYESDAMSWATLNREFILHGNYGSTYGMGFPSGLLMPFGIDTELNYLETGRAIVREARRPAWYLGPNDDGEQCQIKSDGNANGSVILHYSDDYDLAPISRQLSVDGIPHLVRLNITQSERETPAMLGEKLSALMRLRQDSTALEGLYVSSLAAAWLGDIHEHLVPALNAG